MLAVMRTSTLFPCISGQISIFNGYWRRRLCQHATDSVRVRFAPSPTGFVHLGGLRTAFYNSLFAKKYNGKFILRIEDTDQERTIPGSLEQIIDTLKWSQLIPDEGPTFGGNYGPYIQSERQPIYKEMANKLLETNAVYRCFCAPKRLELLKREAAKNRETIKYDNRCRSLTPDEVRENLAKEMPFTIRLKLKDGPITVNDVVYGDVTYDLSKIEGDPIIIKSDSMPTYHFANVVDDHLMRISHVLRGVEWLVSTPKHLMLYEAFGWPAPKFAHLPLIINSDGTKLSKRHDHIRLDKFREAKYYPETIINYLTQMGGGFGALDTAKADRLYTFSQLSESFRLEAVNQNNCRMDTEKIKILNRVATKEFCQSDMNRLVKELREILKEQFNNKDLTLKHLEDTDYVRKVIEYSLDRIFTLKDLLSNDFLYAWSVPKFTWDPSSMGSKEIIKSALSETIELLKSVPEEEFEHQEVILAKLKGLHQNSANQASALKFGTFMRLLRFSLANVKVGSPVGEMMYLLGKHRSIRYLESALEYVDSTAGFKQETQISN